MKILLVGEYSRLHNSLKEGLLKAKKLKFQKEVSSKIINLHSITLEDLGRVKNQALYDIRPSRGYRNITNTNIIRCSSASTCNGIKSVSFCITR